MCPEAILNDSEYLHSCTNTEALEFILTQKVFFNGMWGLQEAEGAATGVLEGFLPQDLPLR